MQRGETETARRFYELALAENQELAHIFSFNLGMLSKVSRGTAEIRDGLLVSHDQKTLRHPVSDTWSRRRSTPKFAVVAHCFYEDVWELISERLTALSTPINLFVTIPSVKAISLVPRVIQSFPEARIFLTPNVGMDILPFLSLIPLLANEGFTAICKVHTKLRDTDIDRVWCDLMLDTLIGSADSFRKATDTFAARDDVYMIGPAATYQSGARLMFTNGSRLSEIVADAYGSPLPEDHWGFFAGSMFWIRTEPLLSLSRVCNAPHPGYQVEQKVDGNLVHAVERSFGLISRLGAGRVGLMLPRHGELSECSVEIDECFSMIGESGIRNVMEQVMARTPGLSEQAPDGPRLAD